jgi:pSer/pThr/pTyr-binding forkhead associated (FHA) protein
VDEGSVNGTFVNGKRINGEHPLKHGDRIRVHRHEFEFVIPDLFDTDATMIVSDARVVPPSVVGEDSSETTR